MNGERRERYSTVVAARLPAGDAAKRALAEADDRPPGALARRFILDGLKRASETQNGPTAA